MATTHSIEMPVDPRFVKRVMSSPKMSAEQGNGNFLEVRRYINGELSDTLDIDPVTYIALSKVNNNDKEVFFTVNRGLAQTPTDIARETELPVKKVAESIKRLTQRGLLIQEESGSQGGLV